MVAAVEGAGVAAEAALQAAGERYLPRAPQQVDVIGHEAPGVAGAARGSEHEGEAFEQVGTVGVVDEDGAALDATSDDVMERARGIEAGAAWHRGGP